MNVRAASNRLPAALPGREMPLMRPPVTLLAGNSLFLDFDGTLVELAERPDAIEVTPRLRGLLGVLHNRLQGRLMLVSGRASADVASWLAPLAVPIIGSHGLEGLGQPVVIPPALSIASDALRLFAAGRRGVLVEDKPMGVALHYRQAPDAEAACHAAAEQAAKAGGLQLQPGKMVVELRPAGNDKGTALRAVMDEPVHRATRPIFIGDDLTDEHAFAAARALGGAGILVGPERDTAATYRLADVRAVHDWLEQACEALA
jgi:trehalose 6-phosphate phosphatase